MHQNAFGGRAPAGPAGGAYSAPPDSLAELSRGRGKWGGEKGQMEERWGGGRKGEDPQCLKCVDANAQCSVVAASLRLFHRIQHVN